MLRKKNENATAKKDKRSPEEEVDLNQFIEKNRIQNEALKKKVDQISSTKTNKKER